MNDELNNLFNGMNDDEFRKYFMKIMNERQREMENFLKQMYGGSPFNPFGIYGIPRNSVKGFSGKSSTDNEDRDGLYEMFSRIFGNSFDDMDIKSETDTDEFGTWESKSWTSPDGSMSFYSSSRMSDIDPNSIEDLDKYFPSKKKKDPLEMFKRQLQKAISEERYEDAAELRDAIESLENKNSEDSEK